MKLLLVCSLLAATAIAEPPVDRYLPPSQRGGGPSALYGAPSIGMQGRTDAIIGNRQSSPRRPSSLYGAPSRNAPSNQYLPPSSQYSAPSNQYIPPQSRTPSSQYGAPAQTRTPSSQYGAPAQSRTPSSQYGAPAQSRTLSSQYGAPAQSRTPSNQYIPPQSRTPSSQYGAPAQAKTPSSVYGTPAQARTPSSQYGVPSSQYSAPSNQYGAPAESRASPSSEYGVPDFNSGDDQGYESQGVDQSRQYLPPGAGRSGDGYDDGSNEPASYNFEYSVKDEPSGNDFGHRESREGDRAEGLYYVLLPDGRKQTVEYEADQDGYKPKISYEDVGVAGGYDSNAQEYSGYSNQDNQNGPY